MHRTGPIRAGFIASVVVVALALGNCGGDDDSTGASGDPSNGRDLYESSCAWCHGFDLRGTERGPAHLSELYGPARASDDVFRDAVANGVPQKHWGYGPMAAVGGLSDDDITDIIAHVRLTQEQEGLIPFGDGSSS